VLPATLCWVGDDEIPVALQVVLTWLWLCAAPFAAVLTDKDLKVLTVGEMGLLLDQVRSGQRPDDPQPPAMTVKAMEYAARFATNKNRDTLVKMRE
jgi:hypothetical protein